MYTILKSLDDGKLVSGFPDTNPTFPICPFPAFPISAPKPTPVNPANYTIPGRAEACLSWRPRPIRTGKESPDAGAAFPEASFPGPVAIGMTLAAS